jgi:hypothetical protein
MIAHPSYLRIIGLANQQNKRELLALLLNELKQEPDHWFAALTAITGREPVRPEDDFDQSVNAWIEWGYREGILHENEDHRTGRATEEIPETPAR